MKWNGKVVGDDWKGELDNLRMPKTSKEKREIRANRGCLQLQSKKEKLDQAEDAYNFKEKREISPFFWFIPPII